MLGNPWDPKLLDIFQSGLPVHVVRYHDEDRDVRIEWNVAKHDEENNKYKKSTIHQRVDVVNKRFARTKDWSQVCVRVLAWLLVCFLGRWTFYFVFAR